MSIEIFIPIVDDKLPEFFQNNHDASCHGSSALKDLKGVTGIDPVYQDGTTDPSLAHLHPMTIRQNRAAASPGSGS